MASKEEGIRPQKTKRQKAYTYTRNEEILATYQINNNKKRLTEHPVFIVDFTMKLAMSTAGVSLEETKGEGACQGLDGPHGLYHHRGAAFVAVPEVVVHKGMVRTDHHTRLPRLSERGGERKDHSPSPAPLPHTPVHHQPEVPLRLMQGLQHPRQGPMARVYIYFYGGRRPVSKKCGWWWT
jgi:hypothetical protein